MYLSPFLSKVRYHYVFIYISYHRIYDRIFTQKLLLARLQQSCTLLRVWWIQRFRQHVY